MVNFSQTNILSGRLAPLSQHRHIACEQVATVPQEWKRTPLVNRETMAKSTYRVAKTTAEADQRVGQCRGEPVLRLLALQQAQAVILKGQLAARLEPFVKCVTVFAQILLD